MTDEPVNDSLAIPVEVEGMPLPSEPAMEMTKLEAEAEAIRRWYELPEDMRRSPDDAEIYAMHIASDLNFHSIISRERLVGAWLMRELFRAKEAEKAAEAARSEAA